MLLSTFQSAAIKVENEFDIDLSPIDTSLQQLKDLAQITKDLDLSRILQNFLIAAMNLRQILTQTDSDEIEGPGELSLTLSRHGRYVYCFATNVLRLTRYHRNLSDEEQKSVLEVFRAAEKGSMRLPLQISLFISPLALLLPIQLHATRYSQANMVLVSEAKLCLSCCC